MIIAVVMQRGPSPVYVEVTGTADQDLARRLAFTLAYEGHSNLAEAESQLMPADELNDFTEVVTPAHRVHLGCQARSFLSR